MKKVVLFSALMLLLFCGEAAAQKRVHSSTRLKPQWVKDKSVGAKIGATGLKVVENSGTSLDLLETDRLRTLAGYLESSNRLNGVIDRNYERVSSDSGNYDRIENRLTFRTETSVKSFSCRMIDGWWEQVAIDGIGLRYNCYTLYAVSEANMPLADNVGVTTRYGARGLWRSALVPGWGQFYKGDALKGSLFLGGTVLLAGGVTFCECMRQDRIIKTQQTHDINQLRQFSADISNYALGRNICIGAAAALYLYNLIDAVVAPGAARIVVNGCEKARYAFAPVASPDGFVLFAANLTF